MCLVKVVFLLRFCVSSGCLLRRYVGLKGIPGDPGWSVTNHLFPTFCSNIFLICFLIVFGSLLSSFFYDFLCFLHHFVEYEICIDFASILGRILTSFSMFFYEFPVRAFTSHEASRSLFLNNSTVFCAQNQGFTLSEKH